MQIWSNPVTEKPALEPCFAAAFHGIELCFLLLSEFINDDRKYVFRRPRIELVAHDIQQQCLLLTEVSNSCDAQCSTAALLLIPIRSVMHEFEDCELCCD